MREAKRRRLEAKGWQVGTTQEFLRLSPEEAAYIDLKVRLAMGLRQWRQRSRLTQADLAKRLQSSQSRIAKMEAGHPSVSLDLLIRSLLTLGASRRELSRIMSARIGRVRGPRGREHVSTGAYRVASDLALPAGT